MNQPEASFRTLSRDERRRKILFAAKVVFVERGFDETSMDDIAAAAGTTKPTVYAHFKSKEELFSAVLEFLRELFHERMGSPEQLSNDPLEAIAMYCGRIIDLVSCKDVLAFHRVVISSAARSPEMGAEVYNALLGSAVSALSAYLQKNGFAKKPTDDAERMLAATVGAHLLRSLYGFRSTVAPDDPQGDESQVDIQKIRETVAVFLAR